MNTDFRDTLSARREIASFPVSLRACLTTPRAAVSSSIRSAMADVPWIARRWYGISGGQFHAAPTELRHMISSIFKHGAPS